RRLQLAAMVTIIDELDPLPFERTDRTGQADIGADLNRRGVEGRTMHAGAEHWRSPLLSRYRIGRALDDPAFGLVWWCEGAQPVGCLADPFSRDARAIARRQLREDLLQKRNRFVHRHQARA